MAGILFAETLVVPVETAVHLDLMMLIRAVEILETAVVDYSLLVEWVFLAASLL
ncbi:MAG: hypothetical protein KDD14_26170 [Saprospiraceae bacterium]|nr:hypothetical protein [Saprospiraceae bacterium]